MKKQTDNLTRRKFLGLLGAGTAALSFGFPAILHARQKARSVIVLGMDGMDPKLFQSFLARGLMPNAKRLLERGAYSTLATSNPPQSPVAWSNFISGTNPGGHGIFDFIARDPSTMQPYLSASRVEGSSKNFRLGQWLLPLKSGELRNLRQGPTFWNALADEGVDCTVLRIPSNFPPTPGKARSLSGLGTPDVHGSYGIFSFFTNKQGETTRDVAGGHIEKVFVRNHAIETTLRGPKNSFDANGRDSGVPIKVAVDPLNASARVMVQGKDLILREGEWSDWVHLRFPMLPHMIDTPAICRFYLKSARNPFALYVTPVNIDPEDPVLPISTPSGYSKQLAERMGSFYTQGLPADTNSLSSGVFDDAQYRDQANFVLNEEFRMFDTEFSRFREGFFFFYFCSLDMNSHTFWRTLDPTHPAYSAELAEKHGDFIPSLYSRMDKAIGTALDRADEETLLIVMSDHGFGSFNRQFNLNSWLMDNGYASSQRTRRGNEPYFADVRWDKTRAYGLGINSLYLNLRGREVSGAVSRGAQAEALKQELVSRLTSIRDPQSGLQVISHVYSPADIYSGPCSDSAPDLVVGYAPGFRASWDTILGKYPKEHILDNKDAWSGDHATDAADMAGVLLSNRSLAVEKPSLIDLAPGILDAFGLPPMEGMTGRAAFKT